MIFGCVPVVPTFFDSQRNLDLAALDKCLSYLEKFSFEAYWVLGTGAEDMSLTHDEVLTIYNHLAEHDLAHKMIVGTGSYSLKQAIKFTEYLSGLSVFKGIHYMPYNKLISDDLIFSHYQDLALASSGSVLYGYSSANWSKPFSFRLVEKLKLHNIISGIKYSTSNIVDTANVLSLQDDSFQVLPAVVKQLVPSLSLGAVAFTTVEAVVYPELINKIYKLCIHANDFDEARINQFKLNSLLQATTTSASKDNFLRLADIKLQLSLMGIGEKYMSRGFFDA